MVRIRLSWSLGAVLLFSGCGGPVVPVESPIREASSQPQQSHLSLPIDTTPGYRARLRFGPNAESMASNWRDIVVADETERGRAICVVLLEAERSTLATVRLDTVPLEIEVVRPCEAAALPERTIASGSVLVDTRTVDDIDLRLLAAPSLEEHELSGVQATITSFTRFDDLEPCREMQAQLVRSREETNRRNAAGAAAFLAEVIIHRREQRDLACEPVAEAETRCEPRPTTGPDVAFCNFDLPIVTRHCASETALLTMLEQRLEQREDVTPDEPPPPVCFPESRD